MCYMRIVTVAVTYTTFFTPYLHKHHAPNCPYCVYKLVRTHCLIGLSPRISSCNAPPRRGVGVTTTRNAFKHFHHTRMAAEDARLARDCAIVGWANSLNVIEQSAFLTSNSARGPGAAVEPRAWHRCIRLAADLRPKSLHRP